MALNERLRGKVADLFVLDSKTARGLLQRHDPVPVAPRFAATRAAGATVTRRRVGWKPGGRSVRSPGRARVAGEAEKRAATTASAALANARLGPCG